MHLTINSDMSTVVKTMARPDSGLEVRDRLWLKITIPNAFIGMTTHLCKNGSILHVQNYINLSSSKTADRGKAYPVSICK